MDLVAGSRARVTSADARIVERAIAGDPRAFVAVLDRHRPALRADVTRLTRRPSETDDVLQEVAIAAWRSISRLEDPEAVGAWLFRIATRSAFALLRAHPQHAELDDDLPGDAGDQASSDLKHALRAALGLLSEQQATVWWLREVDGLAYDEIAGVLGVPSSTVRGSLVLARKRFVDSMAAAR